MSITVRILGDDSDLQKTLGDSTKQLAKYGAAAAAAGAAAATALTVQGLKAVDAQAKLARSLDTSIDSLRALQIAASDSGLDGMDASLKRLNRRLGAAEMGMGEAGKSVEALNLNLAELSGMDADERIAAIADAVRDSGVSMQQAARHAQNLGFEQAEAAAFFAQGGDAIRSYRQEVQDLGLSLSSIDAAKVEAANDQFARLGMLTDGVRQQLAVQVAPLLQAVSALFVDATTDAGGFEDAVASGFNKAVKGAGFAMDAVEGVRRTFEIAGKVVAGFGLGVEDVMLTAAGAIVNKPIEAINELIEALNGIGTISIDPVELSGLGSAINDRLATVRQAQSEMADDLHETLMRPLPSEQFEQYVDAARESADKAARAFQGVGGGLETGGLTDTRTDAEKEEAAKKQEEMKKRLEERVQTIRDANATEVELTNQKFAMENEALNLAFEQELITKQEWFELLRDQKARQEEELTEIEKNAADARNRVAELEAANKKRIMGDALSSLTTLMNSESRKLFEIGKAAAISQSLIATYQGASEALKLGWPLGPIAAASITAGGLANVQAIKSQSFGGGGSGGSGGSSNTQQVNAQAEQVSQRSTSVDISLIGADNRDRAVASSVIQQINDEIERGERINRVGLA